LNRKFSIRELPSARAASITARWEMDLSPGTVTWPRSCLLVPTVNTAIFFLPPSLCIDYMLNMAVVSTLLVGDTGREESCGSMAKSNSNAKQGGIGLQRIDLEKYTPLLA